MPTRPSTFDEQALGYDARAGLPTAVSAAVAQAIVERAGAGADSSLLVECSGRATMILGKGKGIDGLFDLHRLRERRATRAPSPGSDGPGTHEVGGG